MTKFQLGVASFFLLAAYALTFAQAREVYQHRAGTDADHPWTTYYDSDRFTIWYSTDAGDCASLTTQQAQAAANELENIFDVYMQQGFAPPYAANATKYKMGAYVLRNGSNCTKAVGTRFCGGTSTCSEGHAFGGRTGNPLAPGMWLSAGAVSDKWALAHEFMHGLQQAAGAMSGGSTNAGTNFTGWFHESHANLMPHLVYPADVHYCAEMYTRTSHLYYGSTRNRYCNWQLFEYFIHKYGTNSVNNIWITPQSGASRDPFTEFMYKNNQMSQKDFGDVFGDFASRAVIWDINNGSQHPITAYRNRGSALFRNKFNGVEDKFKRHRYTFLEALDGGNAANNRYVSPFMFSPQRYAYNIIRLYPNAANGTVTVKFRGDVQTQNNITNYSKTQNLEPAVANLPNNPGSDWRYRLVAVTGDATSRTGTVTARYSPIMRASDGNPDVSITMQNSETQLYLVVAATPTVHHKISWDQYFYTVYRFPYMVEINGAKPEGFQAITNPTGTTHANGGGFKQNGTTVDATAYVGPNARVLGTAKVTGNARIEGRAVVSGSAQVYGNAVVKDYALVSGGQVYGSAVVSDNVNLRNGQVYENGKLTGSVVLDASGARVYGNAVVGGVTVIEGASAINLSGTAQLLGDIEVGAFTATNGVYFGIIGEDQAVGKNRTTPPKEVTKPRSMTWYGDASSSSTQSSSSVTHSSSSGGEVTAIKNLLIVPKFFNLNNHGIFSYSLGEAASANLKIYDSRGKLLKAVQLNSQGTVDTGLNTSQVLLWRVEGANGKLIEQRVGATIGSK
ncbi:MAG: polymer-forming cytoskeletal protein [Fibromonadaceae bacterium]|jgi:cytoskeletal protein CcmA (bactofilin family)|nr:polymer-forming cytoskeletal protein [Fibromonadaceae bacterium]